MASSQKFPCGECGVPLSKQNATSINGVLFCETCGDAVYEQCTSCGVKYPKPMIAEKCEKCRGPAVHSGGETHSAGGVSSSVMEALLKRVTSLEIDRDTLTQKVGSLEREVVALKAKAFSQPSQPLPSVDCSVCKLDVSLNPYCAATGTLHISEKDCRERVRQTLIAFPFPDVVMQQVPEVKYVMTFHAFSDVYGAPAKAKEDAGEWLKRHLVKYLLPGLKGAKPGFSDKSPDEYEHSFYSFCTTRDRQAHLLRVEE
eukprot:TRINITY_DN5682_c0_g1_i1.p1 TRINITY_DN5682_c0_g1~~TRINITY_DN5682_c0_g1_i1.p1  ORF type:complete len:271 (+),score=49.78 TRINITY_DN5682_c0_g1_i1:43-813(+)